MANYDFLMNVGHGNSEIDNSYDSGAVANGRQEHKEVEIIVDEAISILKSKYGLNPHRDEQNYKDNDLKGNIYKYKVAYSIHINAGGGKRSEAWIPLTKKTFNTELNILSDLAKLGITNGGVKSREYYKGTSYQRTNGVALSGLDYYGEIMRAKQLGIDLTIIELGFIDSTDINIIVANRSKIANILADRIAEGLNVKSVQQTVTKKLVVGSKVKIIGSKYATGQVIPSWAKTKTYTVKEINGDKVLIQEIVSWVYAKDIVLL